LPRAGGRARIALPAAISFAFRAPCAYIRRRIGHLDGAADQCIISTIRPYVDATYAIAVVAGVGIEFDLCSAA
jgi:hypothetical protein